MLAKAPEEPPWTLPRARCSLTRGHAQDALDTLKSGPVSGSLAPYARLVEARAHIALGQHEAALASLDGLSLPGATAAEAQLTRARLLALQGAVQKTDDATKSLIKSAPEALYLRALAREKAGQRLQSIEVYTEVWARAKDGGWDALAQQAAARLGSTLPQLDNDEGRALAQRRRARLSKSYRNEEALQLADALNKGHEPTTRDAKLDHARLIQKARDYPAAAQAFSEVLGAPDKAMGSADELYQYGLNYARQGNYDTASVLYRRVTAQHPSTSTALTASYKLGYMAQDEGDCDRAIVLMQAHRKDYPNSKHLSESLWFEARCRWRQGDHEGASASFGRLLKTVPGSSLAPGAAYWMARAKGLAGDEAGQTAALESVLKRWPTSGWSYFATVHLGTVFPAQPEATAPAFGPQWSARDEVKTARALLDLGLRDWAREVLAPLKSEATIRATALPLAWTLIEAGDFQGGRVLARPFCVSVHKGGDPVAQQACTPRPESGIVSRVAAEYDLDPLVPYGIMTAESNLDPSVQSWAGARGLMQLMPKEAGRLHEPRFEGRPYNPDDLYSAPYNATLGTTELGQKRQSLKGVLVGTDLPAFIASYNGGEEAVRRWLGDDAGSKPFDEFAEDISYGETRRYVKRVLGFVMAYRWVYGDPPELPEP